MEQNIEKENERLKDLLYSKIMFIEQLKADYRNLTKTLEEITNNYNEARDLAIEFRADNKHLNDLLDNALKEQEEIREENERLKEANQSLSMLGTDLASANETVRKEFFRADNNKDMWREKAEKYCMTLQEIKAIATECTTCGDCFDCKYSEVCNTNIEEQALGVCKMILSLITKAEEE